MENKVVLEMKHVKKQYPGVLALNDVSLKLYQGEILALCGENGAGKSTLMKVLSGSLGNTYEGTVCVDGTEVPLTAVSHAKKYGIEMIYQEVNILFDASVAENIFVGNLPGKAGWVDYPQLYRDTQKLLDMVDAEFTPRQTARFLNSGQLQIISILRALSRNPRILVLDEPTSALTNNEIDTLMKLLDQLREQGISCIYISHKLDEVFRISNRIMVMRDGQIVAEHETSQTNEQTLIEEMVGRTVTSYYQKTESEIGDVILRVEGITVPHPTRKGHNIVENVGFSLHRGEILGLAGLVGAGRSEILGAIYGQLTRSVKKHVFINGKEVNIRRPKDAIHAGIGFVTEERKSTGIVSVMSIRENITLASLPNIPGKIFINRRKEREIAQKTCDQFSIKANSVETMVRTLSGGNQQKVVLGKWLCLEPSILLVDEPTRGIDVGARSEIYKWLSDLACQGIAIVMVSSDMPEIISMCDRCLVVSNGRITRELLRGEITQDAIMAAAIN